MYWGDRHYNVISLRYHLAIKTIQKQNGIEKNDHCMHLFYSHCTSNARLAERCDNNVRLAEHYLCNVVPRLAEQWYKDEYKNECITAE